MAAGGRASLALHCGGQSYWKFSCGGGGKKAEERDESVRKRGRVSQFDQLGRARCGLLELSAAFAKEKKMAETLIFCINFAPYCCIW